jgi:hypothetical protein
VLSHDSLDHFISLTLFDLLCASQVEPKINIEIISKIDFMSPYLGNAAFKIAANVKGVSASGGISLSIVGLKLNGSVRFEWLIYILLPPLLKHCVSRCFSSTGICGGSLSNSF